jgi:hypothetical protein
VAGEPVKVFGRIAFTPKGVGKTTGCCDFVFFAKQKAI